MEDIRIGFPQLLVAKHDNLRQTIRDGLRHMSEDEEQTSAAFWTAYA